METRAVAVKSVLDPARMVVTTTLTGVDSPVGDFRGGLVQVRRILDVPASVHPAEVVRAWDQTLDMSGLFTGRPVRYEVGWDEIGLGRVIR